MKKKLFVIQLLFLNAIVYTFAQVDFGGVPYSYTHRNLSLNVPFVEIEQLNMEDIFAEDQKNAGKGSPLRIGIAINVNITMKNAGRWDILPNGDRIWRIGVKSENARAVNFIFDQFIIPKGGEVFVYSPDYKHILGMYDSRSVLPNGDFYTPDIECEEMILEYYEPASVSSSGTISIKQVEHIYKKIKNNTKGYYGDAQGNCHINVTCPEVTPWENQANSVVLIRITQGGNVWLCSGGMLNNVRQDNTPYVLTAEHCYEDGITAWRVVFEYQTSSCTATTGNYNKFAIGAEVVARDNRYTSSDFMLIKITGLINEPYKTYIYLAGWDRSTNNPSPGAAIHHPGGDYKKFSLPRAVSTSGKYWTVSWFTGSNNKGTTEQGSSGSPLFDGRGVVIGQLCCGVSSCTYPYGDDEYGKLSNSWTNSNNANNAKKLAPWLDPDNTGRTLIYGKYWNDPVNISNYSQAITAFNILPNPSNGSVIFSGDFDSEFGTCLVFDLLGKQVYSNTISLNQPIKFNQLNNGIYFVEINTNNKTYKTKMVIAK